MDLSELRDVEIPDLDSPKQKRLDACAVASAAFQAERDRLNRAVKLARDEGASWSDIGMAVGVSKQAAQQRWGD